MLVSLASCFSILLANLLMDTNGKGPGSFVQLDMMRLPLGVLTGMGFIGAGTILRRETLIVGVTTAATLWFCTILGFCFWVRPTCTWEGAATVLGLVVLWVMRHLEEFVRQGTSGDRHARSGGRLPVRAGTPPDDGGFEIRNRLLVGDLFAKEGTAKNLLRFWKWRAVPSDTSVPPFVDKLRVMPGIETLRWMPATQ